MHNLPVEICTAIFLYLKRKDLVECFLVCKIWHTMAITLSWEAATLRNPFQDILDYKDQGKYTRLDILELFEQLPNLNEIGFSMTKRPEEYLEYLLDADMRHIGNINTGSNLFSRIRSDLLFSVYYEFRSSITCICLVYDKNTINFNSQQTNILDFLNRFKKLTKLELCNEHDISLTSFQIQENCSNLEHLEFISDLPISESAMQHATYTIYLVDYFPNQLTDLDIMISSLSIFDWIDIVGMKLALRFMEKAARFNGEMADLISLGHSFRYNSLGGLLVTYTLYLSKLRESITTEMTVPDKTSSIIGSEIFYVLEVNLLVLYNGEECRILNHSLSNCPRLQSLNVTYTTADSSNASFSLKHKEGLISSDQANCDFNVLQMEYTRPTKHFLIW
ncbi:hypothetical protein EDC94DRAFT_583054 [Helicostylum pulchrum]|nr:hypothetical protein EDC94DRAFT_583054 [Helicostylum pulchrum]